MTGWLLPWLRPAGELPSSGRTLMRRRSRHRRTGGSGCTRVLYESGAAAVRAIAARRRRHAARVGDRLLATSVELRLPMGSPLAAGKTGFRLFYDAAVVWNARSVRGQLLKGGAIGVFLSIPVFGRPAVRCRPRFGGVAWSCIARPGSASERSGSRMGDRPRCSSCRSASPSTSGLSLPTGDAFIHNPD